MWCVYHKCGRPALKHRCSGRPSDTKGLVQLCNEVLKYSGSPIPCELLGGLSPAGSLWGRQRCENGVGGVKVQIHEWLKHLCISGD